MYIRYFLLVLVDLTVSFLNFFLAPVVVLFAQNDGWLPRWLWWFQTPDNPLDGDGGWKTEHRRFKIEDKPWKRWYNRTTWLYRNSMYGFCIDVLGAKTLGTDTLVLTGNRAASDNPFHEGHFHYRLYRDEKLIAFQYHLIWAWSKTRCLRLNIGWKLWDFRVGEDRNCQLTFSPNPFIEVRND
jgi:hypothetical protein